MIDSANFSGYDSSDTTDYDIARTFYDTPAEAVMFPGGFYGFPKTFSHFQHKR